MAASRVLSPAQLHIMNNFNHLTFEKILTRKFILGNPKMDCDHLGICYVSDNDDPQEPGFRTGCPRISATFALNQLGVLHLRIPADDLTAVQRLRHFSTPFFTVEESYAFSPSLAKAFGHANRQLTIRPGRYPWQETLHTITIILPLKIS